MTLVRHILVPLVITITIACGGKTGKSGQDLNPEPDRQAGLDLSPDTDNDIPEQPDVPMDIVPDIPVALPETVEINAGDGFVVTISTAPFAIEGSRDGKLIWDGRDLPLLIGRVEEYNPEVRYDPELLLPELEWLGLETVIAYSAPEEGLHRFTFEPRPEHVMVLTAKTGGEGIVTFDLQPEEFRDEVLTAVEYTAIDNDENFYGLGESFDHVARRGLVRQMHMTIDFLQESGYNEAHYPIPLLISTHGSGIFIEDRHPGLFDVCASDPDRIIVRFSNGSLRFHLFGASTPLDVLQRYITVTGHPALPPVWAFGVIQWEDEIDGQDQVLENAYAMREHDLPGSGMWVDRPFATAHESFVFRPDIYPDAAGMVQELNDLGFRMAIWSAPYLGEGVAEEYAIAEANGYFVESDDINFTKFGRLMDFTDPGGVELWQSLVQRAVDLGIEGFKLDYGEDIISGYSSVKTDFNFFNGESSQTMHHWYQFFYHKAYRDLLPEHAFLINRAGCYGDQTITSVVWPGDLCNNFKRHQEDGHVGGLPAAIVGNQTLSASGYPFFGSDTGGYRHYRPEKDVLLRWVQHTALSPVLQFGGAGANCNPWDFKKYEGEDDGIPYVSQYDEETLDIWRRFARLHIRLFPYVYTYAVEATVSGKPLTRPYGMVHPEQGHPDFQYFYGDFFMVAPVMQPDNERDVLIPPGKWFNWFDDTGYEGPTEKTVTIPLDSLFLLVKEGAIIPLLRPTVDTLAPVTVPDVDSYANDPGKLWVHLWPGPTTSSFDLVMGPSFVMKSTDGETEVEVSSLVDSFTGARYIVHAGHLTAPGEHPSASTTSGGEPFESVDFAELETCAACQAMDPQTELLHVIPATSDGTFFLTY
jgi:alpha-D-xyloside xylohydrolase